MNRYQRGQSAIEFVLVVVAVLVFFLLFLFAVRGNVTGKVVENRDFALREVAFTIQDEINLADSSGNGYYREFYLPETVINQEYLLNITDGSIYLRTTNGKHALSIPTSEVVGEPVAGMNTIRKEGDIIYLNA